jgi:hypothetical protein
MQVRTIFTILMLVLTTFKAGSAQASPANFSLFSVDEVSADFYQIGFYRDSYFDEYDNGIDRGANLNTEMTLLKYGFYKSTIHMFGNETRLREAGLEFQGGIHVWGGVDVFYWHQSRHLLDAAPVRKDDHFPQLDAVGVRFHFVGKGK